MLSCDGKPISAQDQSCAGDLRWLVSVDVFAPTELRVEPDRESVEHHQVAMAQDLVSHVREQSKDAREDFRCSRLHIEHRRWTRH